MKCDYRWLILFALVCTSPIFSQELGLKHYARKLKIDSLLFPGDEMRSTYFNIPFPDSLFSFGSIEIKKAKLENKRAFELKHTIENHKINSTIIKVKGKKNVKVFTCLLKKKIPNLKQLNEAKLNTVRCNSYPVKIYFTSSKNRFYIKLEKIE